MNAGVKVLIGLILLLIGLFLFVDSVYPILGSNAWIPGDWLTNFLIVLTGGIPIFLIVIGLFVVWLEVDELKAQKELNKEEKQEKEEHKDKEEHKSNEEKPEEEKKD
jgi:uncharacterized membrane protein YcjF (UPF0283 family)